MDRLEGVLTRMTQEIGKRLGEDQPSVYLYGSAVLEDFRPEWSDIDILVLTQKALTQDTAQDLVMLRQELVQETGEPLFRNLEGAIVSVEGLLEGKREPVVYWGTSGQRLQERYTPDVFSRQILLRHGRLLSGEDVRQNMTEPSYSELRQGIVQHYETIRQYARVTGENLYAFGWMLDIARGLYTLDTGCVIAKTQAGVWALERGLCPDAQAMEMTLAVRREPERIREEAIRKYAASMGDRIQRFADVLEAALTD